MSMFNRDALNLYTFQHVRRVSISDAFSAVFPPEKIYSWLNTYDKVGYLVSSAQNFTMGNNFNMSTIVD